MNQESYRLDLAENFTGFQYISNGSLHQSNQFVQIKLEPIPVKQIALFMSCLALAVPLGLIVYGSETATVVMLSAVTFCGAGMFVGLLWMVNLSDTGAKLPRIDLQSEELELPSGTRIGNKDIACFRQYECKTRSSNFRLVLTLVETRQQQNFAVCAEIGRFKSTKLGAELANCLNAPLEQHTHKINSRDSLGHLGLQ